MKVPQSILAAMLITATATATITSATGCKLVKGSKTDIKQERNAGPDNCPACGMG